MKIIILERCFLLKMLFNLDLRQKMDFDFEYFR